MTPNMEISTVVGCRMGCDYCPQKIHTNNYRMNFVKGGHTSGPPTVMSWETFETCLSKIPHNVDIVFAGMAEPWLNPECTTMVLDAAINHRVSVYTTCSGMTMQDVERIKKVPFNHFCLHLPDDSGVMKLTVDEYYLEVLEACLEIPAMNKMVIGNLHPKVREVVGDVADGSASLISRAGNLKTLAITKKKGKLMCSATGPKIDHNILLPNGDVLLCCMMYDTSHNIGNLLHDSYDDLFLSAEYQNVMDGLNDESSDIKCRHCEIAQQI